jgi:hypothetical protein
MKGETLIKRLRERYGPGPVTIYSAKSVYNAPDRYIKEVFKKAVEVGILKRTQKCKTAYMIDPDPKGSLVCSLDQGKPYEESICPIVEELIECAVKGNESCSRILNIIKEVYALKQNGSCSC